MSPRAAARELGAARSPDDDADAASRTDDEMMEDSPFRRAAVEFHATRDRGTKRPAFSVPHAKLVAVALGVVLAGMTVVGFTLSLPTFTRVPVAVSTGTGSLAGGPYLFALRPAGEPMPLRPGRSVRVIVSGRPPVDVRVDSVVRRVDRAELGARYGLVPPGAGSDRLWSVAVVTWDERDGDPPAGDGAAQFSVETGRQSVGSYIVQNGRPATSASER